MTLQEFKAALLDAKEIIQDEARGLGRDVKAYCHWTGGDYNTDSDDYHICIRGDGTIINTLPLYVTPEATYHRNTGSIAITLDCCRGYTAWSHEDVELGDCPPTDAQIECLAQVIAVICDVMEIPVDIQHVMTHAEAADNMDGEYYHEPYGPENGCERSDLTILHAGEEWMSGGDILRGKAIFYMNQRSA